MNGIHAIQLEHSVILGQLKPISFILQTASNKLLILGSNDNTIYLKRITGTSQKVIMIYGNFSILYFFHHSMHHKMYKPGTVQMYHFHLFRQIHTTEDLETTCNQSVSKL